MVRSAWGPKTPGLVGGTVRRPGSRSRGLTPLARRDPAMYIQYIPPTWCRVKKRTPKQKAGKRAPQPPPAVMETKVFKTGNSYAVRLPKVLYSGGEAPVYVQTLDNGKLLIMPKLRKKWPSGFL